MKQRKNDDELFQKKSLGQVFLNTDIPVKKIVQLLISQQIKSVIEIGPGGGILTRALLDAGLYVTAVEKDSRFADRLHSVIEEENHPRLKVVNQDVLDFNFESWISTESHKDLAIVGNIPYNISTPIVAKILPVLKSLRLATLMVQKEFGERIFAQCETKNYSSLSVFCQLRSKPKWEFDVPRSMFTPVPKVDSVVFSLMPLEEQPHSEELLAKTEKICRGAFTLRRKKLRNAVKPFLSVIAERASLDSTEIESKCPVDLNRRPETLSPREFVELTKFLTQ